ncbi:RES family NAD+ phosphorylase [Telluria sp. B2]
MAKKKIFICSTCIPNKHLSRVVYIEGSEGHCSNCNRQKPKGFEIERLAALIAPIISQHFWTSDDIYRPTRDEREAEPTTVFDLGEIVMGLMNADIDFRDELVDAIVEGEDCDIRNGEIPFFEHGGAYAQIPEDDPIDYFTPRWKYIVEELKHNRRFFSESVREFFDGIFNGVDDIMAVETSPVSIRKVVRNEPEGFTVYRGRIIDSNEIEKVQSNPFKEVGPTPKEKARAGRMSPEGVVALYCATEKETAIAELHPAIGQTSAVIDLRFSRELRLLDFKRLESALDDGWSSYFDPKYREKCDARDFLRQLHYLISQPVMPSKEADYLITQTMAEYLAHVYEPGFDGIVFSSSQFKKGTNIVLFARKDPFLNSREFPVTYVPGTLTFHQTEAVAYTNREINRNVQASLWE